MVRPAGPLCVVAAVSLAGLAAGAAPARASAVDPVGLWHCLMYGSGGDQRFYLLLDETQRVRMARVAEALERRWRLLGDWTRRRQRLGFEDAANGREFEADLGLASLGGTWQAHSGGGGWWCAPMPEHARGAAPPGAERLMRAPVPSIMTSPHYPRQAIREAKEGRAVSCFFVNDAGEITAPDLIELTDDVFRGPTLAAVAGSRYRSRDDDPPSLLPACRSYTYELTASG